MYELFYLGLKYSKKKYIKFLNIKWNYNLPECFYLHFAVYSITSSPPVPQYYKDRYVRAGCSIAHDYCISAP